MKTFGEVTAEVLRYGFGDGPQVNKARIEDWINEAQLQIARKIDGPEFQAKKEQALTIKVFKYTLPNDFLRMSSIYYPETMSRLKPYTLIEFDEAGGVEGTPTGYTIYGNELWLLPMPEQADTLELRYIKRPARMTAESDIPTLHEDYLHLLVDYATARAFRAEDDPESATTHENRYKLDLANYAVDMGTGRQDDIPRQLKGTW